MTETAFTPGPWKVFTTKTGNKLIGIGGPTGETIADCGFGVWRGAYAEALANAHLMAASPDGYALAETIIEFFGDIRDGKPVSTDRMNEIWTQAEVYLCKARGHQHGEHHDT